MDSPREVPVVSIIGKSDSGKTGVLEGLVRELVSRGYRVATVKHHVHEVDIDVPGKDSWRHARAGAEVTMISSPAQFAVVRKVERERTLEELAEAAGDVDILVTEGFRRAGRVRIEVSRRARSDETVCDPCELFALVTDNEELARDGLPVLALRDSRGLADLVERAFLGPASSRRRVAGGSAASSAGGEGDEGRDERPESPRAPAEDCPSAGPSRHPVSPEEGCA